MGIYSDFTTFFTLIYLKYNGVMGRFLMLLAVLV